VVKQAEAHTAWGHRKVWAMTRHEGHQVSASTALRIMRARNLLQPSRYTHERRHRAAARRAAFPTPPVGPNQVWQLDFSRVRDHPRWHLATGRLRRLLVKVRVRLAHLIDRESA
jgi:hypothetical protein